MAITADTARTIGTAAAVIFALLGIGSAIMLKSLAKKFALLVIFGLLALLAWTQRSALDTCIDVVRETGAFSATCEFFGFEVGFGT